MADVKDIIERILSNPKLTSDRTNNSTVYHDEPIIRTAAQMKSYTPPKYQEMRRLAVSHSSAPLSYEEIFVKQGRFMEDFEDDYAFHGEFFRYFPTYQSMNNQQLRGYFTWRTRVRRGIVEQTSLSFVFVYIYELINMIGVKSAEEGFTALKDFGEKYRVIDARSDRYIKQWLNDYAVYYGLDSSLLSTFSSSEFDNALAVLLEYASHTTDEVFAALAALSSYNIENSKLYKKYPEDVKEIVCGVFAGLSQYCADKRKKSLCERLFGRRINCCYQMFNSAVFHDTKKYKDYEYAINAINRYYCKNGQWSCDKYYGNRSKSQGLGAVLKTVDSMIRERYAFGYPISHKPATRLLTGIIEKEITDFIELKRKRTAPKIEIDISQLQEIRHASEITRDKLIVDDAQDEPIIAAANEPAALPEPPVNTAGLDGNEYRLLHSLLYGEDYTDKGVMLSVLADSVNEKLFDIFSDTVIVFNGDTPELIEDYKEELKGIIG